MQVTWYLSLDQRKEFINSIKFIQDTYFKKISPAFKNIEREVEQVQLNHYNKIAKNFNPDFHDPGDFAEESFFRGLDYYDSTMLMEYNSRLLWITLLYQYWEQQLRKFLYKELTRNHTLFSKKNEEITFKDFIASGKLKDFIDAFKIIKFDLNDLNCWDTINELRLLNNVIKHGEGSSAEQLRNFKPSFFVTDYYDDSLVQHMSTLNNISLNVTDENLSTYFQAIIEFWESVPEYLPEKRIESYEF